MSHEFKKEQIKASIDECMAVPQLAEKLYDLGYKFPYPEYRGGQWKVLQAISIVLQYAVAQLRLEFRKRGEVDFIEIAQQAELALGPPENPTDLSLVLDYQYRHILVDEFQDTSISQRNLLKSLTGAGSRMINEPCLLLATPCNPSMGSAKLMLEFIFR